MKNPFATKKKKSPIIHTGIIVSGNNTISGSISSLSSSLTPIMLSSQGISGCLSVQGVTGSSGWGYASAATFTYLDPDELMKRRKAELMKEYEQNPELFSEIIVELRKEKIRQIRDKSQIK